jgi:hypothetical protein
VEKPLGNKLLGRPGKRFEINIKVDLRGSGEGEKEIGLSQDHIERRFLIWTDLDLSNSTITESVLTLSDL